MSEQSTTTETKTKRASICDKVYVTPDGESRSASESATSLEFRFKDGTVKSLTPADFPESMQRCATWHGLSQKLGDAYSGVKGDVASAIEQFETVFELITSGEWVEKASGVGSAPSLVADAIKRALEAEGQEVDETRFKGIQEQVKDKDTRKGAQEDPAIAAQLAAIKAERAAERAKKAAEAAQGAKVGVSF